jgi:hypothetical protein
MARKILCLMTVATVILALSWPLALGGSSDVDRALASRSNEDFCEIAHAEDLVKRFGKRMPLAGVKLVVDKEHVERGKLVQARLLNFTQRTVSYGAEFKIQRHNQAGWETDPSSPDGPWPRRRGVLRPGRAGGCYRFVVPPKQRAGDYRFFTRVKIGATEARRTAQLVVRSQ